MTAPSNEAIAQAFREYDEGDIVQLRMILARARELDAKPEQVHTCSYYCDRPGCLKAQRDELRDRLEWLDAAKGGDGGGLHTMVNHDAEPHCIGCYVLTANGPESVLGNCNECGHTVAFVPATPPAQAAESVQVASNPGAILSNEAVVEAMVEAGLQAIIDPSDVRLSSYSTIQAIITAALLAAHQKKK